MSISAITRRLVRQRASDRCEYCRLAQTDFALITFHVEHVIAKQHGGTDDADNLCLSCHWCNLHKGPNLTSLAGGKLTRLYNPRIDVWSEHFTEFDGQIGGLTDIGEATANLLNMNDRDRVELRLLAIDR